MGGCSQLIVFKPMITADPNGSDSLRQPEVSGPEVLIDPEAISGRVQSLLDDTHRELAWIRAALIALFYTILSLLNIFTLEGEARVNATVFSLIVVVSFTLFACLHRYVEYPARQTNLVTFGEILVLQLDSIAFSVVTDDLMSGFAVYIMMIAAGIFMTRARWVMASVLMLLVTWTAALMLREVQIDMTREALMLVSAAFGAFFFYFVRLRSAQRLAEYQLREEKYKESLEHALSHIETLSGLLPICANCKSIRTEDNVWTELDVYVRERSDVEFTHSVCPDCHVALYPELQGK